MYGKCHMASKAFTRFTDAKAGKSTAGEKEILFGKNMYAGEGKLLNFLNK